MKKRASSQHRLQEVKARMSGKVRPPDRPPPPSTHWFHGQCRDGINVLCKPKTNRDVVPRLVMGVVLNHGAERPTCFFLEDASTTPPPTSSRADGLLQCLVDGQTPGGTGSFPMGREREWPLERAE